uniref:ATP synthase subunit a n=1 Tax=Xenogryllus marmoratus TaxID=323499 RepID=A0A7L9QCU8_9ORTH|nr:ATP synthase F0 subunit 6 [Xenogryllus marmoratus]
MMTNLFSTFDPATSIHILINWTSTMLVLIFLPYSYWKLPNWTSLMFNKINNKLHNEFKLLLGNKSKGMTLMYFTILSFMMNNLLGLMPYIFTSSSHLSFSMSMALPLWISMMLFGWFKNTNYMFAHLVPNGTPAMLMPFMVMIESIINVIRPGTLSVRLAANMIAGHLLLTLLGNTGPMMLNSMFLMQILITTQIMLLLLETAVSPIQSYVFAVLTTLYSSEVN